MSRGFRVWDVEAEEYLPNSNGTGDGVLGISADGKNVIWLEDGEATFFEDGHSVIIERSTGLKDKNGKEICEGDIVKNIEGVNETAVCVWDESNAEFDFRCRDGKYTRDNVKSWLEMYEVIGNVNENPELIGGEDE